ncbi:unnamed protein product [Lasius platythorax]|uniref:Uncharacterized protein n=1 Tax=Lasius platythorax TaxID=488582 RepID=A0AAV2PAQ0_9HYME
MTHITYRSQKQSAFIEEKTHTIAISHDEIQNVYDGSMARGHSSRPLTQAGTERKDINGAPRREDNEALGASSL